MGKIEMRSVYLGVCVLSAPTMHQTMKKEREEQQEKRMKKMKNIMMKCNKKKKNII